MTRPRVSLLFLTYNQRNWVDDAAQACLAQQGTALDILFSDDASTDGTYERLQELALQYRGHHQVRVRQNLFNLGIGGHYNAAVAACEGDFIITAAGDDICLPHRVQTLVKHWEATGGEADLVSSYLWDMTSTGERRGLLKVDNLAGWRSPEQWLKHRPKVIGAAHGFSRRLFDVFGPIPEDVAYEDQIMSMRACCLGGGVTVPEPLLFYRQGGFSSSEKVVQVSRYARLRTKHVRQLAVYRAVERDLIKIGRADLCSGRIHTKQAESKLILALLGGKSWYERFRITHSVSGWRKIAGFARALTLPWRTD
jgi:glycosyltransferase involved in cell wall biosynthesis